MGNKDKRRGLYGKYLIAKADGTKKDPNSQYFVLRVDEDPHARRAVLAYARSVKGENPRLAEDLVIWIRMLEPDLARDYLDEVIAQEKDRVLRCLGNANGNITCQVCGSTEKLTECTHTDNTYAGHYCMPHAAEMGFCWGCGAYWGMSLGSTGFCPNCEMEAWDE